MLMGLRAGGAGVVVVLVVVDVSLGLFGLSSRSFGLLTGLTLATFVPCDTFVGQHWKGSYEGIVGFALLAPIPM